MWTESEKLQWEDRLSHENWKVRYDANVDLALLFDSISDPKDPRLLEYGHYLKMIVADCNPTVQDKALDALIAYLKAANADAGRYAHPVCDAIVDKCLTALPDTLDKVRTVFMLWIQLGAAQAFLDAMEKAIKNKVSEAVVAAVDVMFQALSEFGLKVVPPERILNMLSELSDHHDQKVRVSSGCRISELCRWIGEDSVKSILFEKARDTMINELVADLAQGTGTAKPNRKMRESCVQPELHIERNPFHRVHTGIHNPTDWNEIFNVIAYGGPEQSVEGMKAVYCLVDRVTNASEGSLRNDLLKHVDQLVSILANKVKNHFDFRLIGASRRSCNYVLITLIQIFQNKTLVRAIQETTLGILISEILHLLCRHMDTSNLHLRALDMLMLEILDNVDQTSSFVVFINLLRQFDSSRWPAPASNGAVSVGRGASSSLVVDILMEKTEALRSTIDDVELDRILESIHVYLQYLGWDGIERRFENNDRPLRMVHTILRVLVELRGTAIEGHLSKVLIEKEPEPILLTFINFNLQILTAARKPTPAGLAELVGQVQHLNTAASIVPSTPASGNVHTRTRPVDKAGLLNNAASSVSLSAPPQASLVSSSSPELVPFPVIANSMSHYCSVKRSTIKLGTKRSV